jgi:hypothetical protein
MLRILVLDSSDHRDPPFGARTIAHEADIIIRPVGGEWLVVKDRHGDAHDRITDLAEWLVVPDA